jgi:hypothetical protein
MKGGVTGRQGQQQIPFGDDNEKGKCNSVDASGFTAFS